MRMTEQEKSARDQPAARERNSRDWDIQELLQCLDNDQGFLCELLRIFRADSQVNLQEAKSAFAEGNLEGLMRAAHTMKGMLRNLSMNRAAEIAFALEVTSRQGKGNEAGALLSQLEQAIAELLPKVEAQLAEVKT